MYTYRIFALYDELRGTTGSRRPVAIIEAALRSDLKYSLQDRYDDELSEKSFPGLTWTAIGRMVNAVWERKPFSKDVVLPYATSRNRVESWPREISIQEIDEEYLNVIRRK